MTVAPAAERRILLVCSGNTCRSPIAAALLCARIRDAGPAVEVRSAGTTARGGVPVSPHALAVLAERGLDGMGHRADPVDAVLLAWATDIWVMTDRHRATISRRWPGAARTAIRLLSEAAGSRGDVADPIGGQLSDYRRTADELATLVDAAWQSVAQPEAAAHELPPDPSAAKRTPSGATLPAARRA